MRTYRGRVVETLLEPDGRTALRIACPPGAVPLPGQFVTARSLADRHAALPVTLFLAETWDDGFVAAPPAPFGWGLGSVLALRGPQGHGFHLPPAARRLALASFESISRLAPLALMAHERKMEVALFTDAPLPMLPAAVEAYPLAALPDVLHWADLLALDLPLPRLKGLRETLSLRPSDHLPCPTQVLLLTLMPCAGMAECGACAVPTRNGTLLACLDGPVFDLNLLNW